MTTPSVEEVRPGVWSIPVPIPISPLGYVLVYALMTSSGPFLIDAGWNTDEAFTALDEGLRRAGSGVGEVRGIMVTHIHPDHYGLAGRVRAESGAWVGLHPRDAALIRERYLEPDDLLASVLRLLRRAGAPDSEIETLRDASLPVRALVDAIEPDVVISDGDVVGISEWHVRAIWTPGHTPGHLCFHLPEEKLLLTGDHVLPRITPNISYHPQSGSDPLGDYLRSLGRVAKEDIELVLPAHEYRFTGLAARTWELQEHHDARFAEAVAAVRDGLGTAWEISSKMTWSRPWDEIDGFMRRAALAEGLAHLRALEARGTLKADDGSPVRWRLAGRP